MIGAFLAGLVVGFLGLPALFMALILLALYRHWRRESAAGGSPVDAATFEKAFSPKDRG
jgi:hypothetical protein